MPDPRPWRKWLASALAAIGAVSAFGAILLARVIFPSRGEWRSALEGKSIGTFPLEDETGDTIRIAHPAYVYFFRTDCPPCKDAARTIASFAAAGSKGLPVYAVTIDPIRTRGDLAAGAGAVRVGRLLGGAPQLNFIQDVPLIVRTNVRSTIVRAYVGIPSVTILEGM